MLTRKLCEISDRFLGAICDDECPEGTFGLDCMGICACDSSQYVCDNIQGCVCQKGFGGEDCMTPRSAFQEMAGGKHFIANAVNNTGKRNYRFIRIIIFCVCVGGQNTWGIIVLCALLCVITVVLLYYRRHVQNLKTGMNHVVRYLANDDPPSQVDPHHFDNPVYGFQPAPPQSTANDSSTLLNIRHHRPQEFARGMHFKYSIQIAIFHSILLYPLCFCIVQFQPLHILISHTTAKC